MAFTRMDQLHAGSEDVPIIAKALAERQAAMPQMIKTLLRQLEHHIDGFPVDQLVHALQTATRAENDGANEEMIVAALCHDVGKAISDANHGAISAEILKPYIRDDVVWMVRVHQDFQGRHYYAYFDKDPNAREQYRGHPAFDLAEQFADEWDQTAFDPDYPTLPLEHFEPLVRATFSAPKRF